MGFTQARQVMALLGPGYQAVRPDRFATLLREAAGLPLTAAVKGSPSG
jgi:hypothetical protein